MAKLFKTFDYGTTPNAFDWLKFIALTTMIVDHIGHYFFPEADWVRVIGRIAFPIFLFLVGYSANFKFNRWLCVGAALVTISAMQTGHPVFPLNILWAILLYRIIMDKLKDTKIFQEETGMLFIALLMFFLPAAFLTEYGTQALMFIILGYCARTGRNDSSIQRVAIGVFAFWIFQQALSFEFDLAHIIGFCVIAILQAAMIHTYFWERTPQLATAPGPKTARNLLVVLIARNTLLLYVLHVLLFHYGEWLIYPERVGPGIVWIKL